MFPLKTILYPTDETTTSTGAWRLAIKLAKDHGSEIVVLHVALPPVPLYSEDDIQWKQPDITPQNDLELLRKTYANEHDIPVRHVVTQGDASEVIVQVAKDEKASLIVMGTHGRKGIGRFVLGSVAEHVLRMATCPVVTVKGDWTPPVE
jgi:nucleotide-binding universal stress UspA family protein